jgi:hypothetical protein
MLPRSSISQILNTSAPKLVKRSSRVPAQFHDSRIIHTLTELYYIRLFDFSTVSISALEFFRCASKLLHPATRRLCRQDPESSQMLRTDRNSFIYTPARNDVELSLVLAYRVPVPEKSMVITFEWTRFGETTGHELDLAWSDSLGHYFAYMPTTDSPGLSKGPTINLPGRGKLEIRLLSWPSRSSVSQNVVSGLYAGIKASRSDTAFTHLQRIHENGTSA